LGHYNNLQLANCNVAVLQLTWQMSWAWSQCCGVVYRAAWAQRPVHVERLSHTDRQSLTY